jgi:hypothetical protein
MLSLLRQLVQIYAYSYGNTRQIAVVEGNSRSV